MSRIQRSDQNGVPMVTVAMSVLNGGDCLQLAVQSIFEQTFQDWELLILDDGSTDGAIDRLLYEGDPRIVVIRDGQTRGLSARLNQAINMARGRYLARMDHDDISHPDRLFLQLEYLENNPEIDLVSSQCVVINQSDCILGFLQPSHIDERICETPWRNFFMPHPTWMGRTEWFQKNNYKVPAPYCCEDQELLLRTYKFSNFKIMPEKLLAYRVKDFIPISKRLRTHLSMLIFQIEYFKKYHDYYFIFLAILSMSFRVTRDIFYFYVLGSKGFQMNIKKSSFDSRDYFFWKEIIQLIKSNSL